MKIYTKNNQILLSRSRANELLKFVEDFETNLEMNS